MTSNLELARKAIEAEIGLAKQGLAYYQAQVTALETTLGQLRNFGNAAVVATKGKREPKGEKAAPEAQARRGRPPKAAKPVKVTKAPKEAKARSAKGAHDLPFTGGDYWFDLVTSEPQTAKDILKASVAGLGFEPTPEQVKKLQQRMVFVLNSLVKTKKIQDSGVGRERRYFK
jgi:hypothetical protein